MKTNLAIIESDSVIASMTRASFALAEAVSVSQTKTIIDVARAAEIYAKRQHLSESAINQATSVKVEAMRKLGEILRETPKNQGAKGSAVPNRNRANLDATPTLDELGLTKKESAVAQKLASLSDEAFEEVRSGSMTIAKAVAVVSAEKARPAAKPETVVEPIAEEPPEDTELDAVKEALSILNEENDRLNDKLAVAQLDATEEEKSAAHTTILALRAENKTLTATNKALILSRDSLMEDVVQLKRQCQMQRKEIDKLKNTK